jgi:integrase
MKGSVYKRCGCPPELDGRGRGRRRACRLPHGSWCFVADVPVAGTGKRRQVRRSGFVTKALAEEALASHLEQAARMPASHDGGQRVGEYLDAWLEAKAAAGLRDNTLFGYRHHVEHFLKPHLGHLRLRDLHPTHVEALLVALGQPQPDRKPLGAASVRRVHATLRSALSSAKRKRLIPYNPAVDLDLPRVSRPKVRPWQAAELGRFLDVARADRLSPVFELMAATGVRRGEALGLRWDDVDLDRADLVVRRQLLQVADQPSRRPCPYCGVTHTLVVFGRPKTSSGEDRLVEFDSGTVRVLRAHQEAQEQERAV